jgi:hypothetical protein
MSDSEMASLLRGSDLSPSGIVATKEQLAWVKTRQKPNRCVFSTTAKRIVIRPDHFCGWTSTWIGRRNHKFFILFNVWGFVYMIVFLVCDVNRVINDLSREDPSPVLALFLIYGMMGLMFAFMTGGFASSHLFGMIQNQTSWESWNRIKPDRFDRGAMENAEELCGPSARWYLWLCPVSPWAGITNEDLVASYPPYRADDHPVTNEE